MIHKEIFPYKYYTEERLLNKKGNIDDAIKYDDIDKTEFIESIKHADALID